MNNKLNNEMEKRGYCCMYSFIKDTMGWQTKELARELGVSTRCIRDRRRQFRLHKIKPCEVHLDA